MPVLHLLTTIRYCIHYRLAKRGFAYVGVANAAHPAHFEPIEGLS